ncbi:hypothetical protein L4D09_14220 [Photobacterium makurazakiensis]|uniref:hypothetical protein n=1 Tax=Photobacterium makurazakiensis TaxID=2910234 RepID=UPI003D11BE07
MANNSISITVNGQTIDIADNNAVLVACLEALAHKLAPDPVAIDDTPAEPDSADPRYYISTGQAPVQIRLAPFEKVSLNEWLHNLNLHMERKITSGKLLRGLIQMYRDGQFDQHELAGAIRKAGR